MTVQTSRCPVMKTHEAKHPYRYGTAVYVACGPWRSPRQPDYCFTVDGRRML